MSDLYQSGYFQTLDATKEAEFRAHAREVFSADDGVDAIKSTWHPVMRQECLTMVHEKLSTIVESYTE